ncbi:MAG TPA: alpha/beta fold hydrolase [Steroidobacteraceae bacterium]|nr:alpha/beta fold hydrolase [Steroidobacteraceae bacterium]
MSGLHLEVRGNGPTLALLHGWGLNLRVWDGLADALSDRFRIVAVDLPGHGLSDWLPESGSLAGQAEQVHEAVSALAGSYSLLGWSLGGQIALQLAAAGPDAAVIDRLVLIAATPRLSAGPDWPCGAPPQRLAAQEASLRTDYRRTVADFLELQVRGSAGGEAALAQLRAALFAHGEARPQALARGLELLRDGDLRPLLSAVAQPALVIAGQYDRVTLPAASQALAELLKDARFIEIRRAAHAPFLSHLPQVSALLTEFLRPNST